MKRESDEYTLLFISGFLTPLQTAVSVIISGLRASQSYSIGVSDVCSKYGRVTSTAGGVQRK